MMHDALLACFDTTSRNLNTGEGDLFLMSFTSKHSDALLKWFQLDDPKQGLQCHSTKIQILQTNVLNRMGNGIDEIGSSCSSSSSREWQPTRLESTHASSLDLEDESDQGSSQTSLSLVIVEKEDRFVIILILNIIMNPCVQSTPELAFHPKRCYCRS